MNIILERGKFNYASRIAILLITAALVTGMVGCDVNRESYTLTIASTTGGAVVEPGEGTFTYYPGTTVNLVAEAEEGYCFVRWTYYRPGYLGLSTGGVGPIEDIYAAATTVTVNYDCGVTAHFVEGIRDWYDLDAVRDNLSGVHILMNDLDSNTPGYEELAGPTANDGKGWRPIGNGVFDPYAGTFDGQGYEIRDLFINRPDESDVGLFSHVGETGIIKNTGVAADVTGYSYVGGLVGMMLVLNRPSDYDTDYRTISNSYSRSSVNGMAYVGGLVGLAYNAVVSDCYSTGSINGDESAGGLAGVNLGDVYNSFYNYDEVLINGKNIITVGALCSEDFNEWLANNKSLDIDSRLSREDGYYLINDVSDFKQLLAFGQNSTLKFRLTDDLDLASEPNFYIPYLAGEFDGNGHGISNLSFEFGFISQVGLFGCLARGGSVTDLAADNVSTTGHDYIGGLVGYNFGTVSNSRSTGDISGNDWGIGGLVGANGGTVSDSYSAGNISGGNCVGGLAGENGGTVRNSYSTGTVTGSAEVGGLAGFNHDVVSNSYSTGNVTGDEVVGGLVGENDGAVRNSYSTGTVTGSAEVGGLVGRNYGWTVSNSFWDIETSGQATSDGGTGKNTTEMKDIGTFADTETEGLDEPWEIVTVAGLGTRNPSYVWNIVDDETYPFLSWQP